MDVIGKTVQQHHDRAVRGPRLVISNVENAGIDVAKWFQPMRRGCRFGHGNSPEYVVWPASQHREIAAMTDAGFSATVHSSS
jgi:hypothetical protein